MDRTIDVKVTGSNLTKDNRSAGVRGESNSRVLRIEFDAGWDGYAKKVTFWDAKGLNPVVRTLTADLLENAAASTRIYLCPIPGEAMAETGMMEFIIDGYVDGKRARSIPDKLMVTDAPISDNAGEPSDPTPTQVEQMQAQYESIMDTIGDAAVYKEDAADSAYQANLARKNAEFAETAAADARAIAEAARDNALAHVNTAQAWAEKAQAEAERATVPAVEGVYNIILKDRATGDKYALIVEGGALKLLGVDYDTVTENPVLIDSTSGVAYEMIVENAVLKLMEV